MANLCNLDGEILPESEARVPVLDRGFLFGDSVYEVIRTRAGVPFAWPEHLSRLRSSAAGISMELDLDDRAVMRRIAETLAAAGNEESYVRIIVSRGTGSEPNIDLSCAPGPCRWAILVRSLAPRPRGQLNIRIVERLRNDRRALDPAVKSGNYLNNVLGLAEARSAGASDALFLNHEGRITEASTSNVFSVKNGAIRTPFLRAGILAGITRMLLLDCCRRAGLDAGEEDLTADDLRAADEVFVTSTLRDLAPVATLDGVPVPGGAPGPVTAELSKLFESYCAARAAELYGPELERLLA
ncbi:MAG: aminotransferase class IV [Planctomycetota bacterium]